MGSALDTPTLRKRLFQVRQRSEHLIEGLQSEDLCLQGMADASPPKWHLAHTTWFFETFLLEPHLTGYESADRRWGYLFNSYYDTIGTRHPRPQRGLLTRPSIGEVVAWRHRVNQGLEALMVGLERDATPASDPMRALLELGLQHEQQHQELLQMDVLDGFSRNPLEPAFCIGSDGPEARFDSAWAHGPRGEAGWIEHRGGLVEIGHPDPAISVDPQAADFHFDNEGPRHRVWLDPFAIGDRLVTNSEFACFIADGGYRRADLWMSEGWVVAQERDWQAPLYWRGDWEFTLSGRKPRHPDAPVRHLSWFEADAYARWAGARLPSEAEWEWAASTDPPASFTSLPQAYNILWQWTSSPYRPYPGFTPAAGAVGEYNGKFMTSQFVLRGSCFLTPAGHGRLTYRNFFPPASRWMAGGLRLARPC